MAVPDGPVPHAEARAPGVQGLPDPVLRRHRGGGGPLARAPGPDVRGAHLDLWRVRRPGQPLRPLGARAGAQARPDGGGAVAQPRRAAGRLVRPVQDGRDLGPPEQPPGRPGPGPLPDPDRGLARDRGRGDRRGAGGRAAPARQAGHRMDPRPAAGRPPQPDHRPEGLLQRAAGRRPGALRHDRQGHGALHLHLGHHRHAQGGADHPHAGAALHARLRGGRRTRGRTTGSTAPCRSTTPPGGSVRSGRRC